MSGIFGLVHLDGRPVTPELLNRMESCLPPGGYLEVSSRIEGPAGLGRLQIPHGAGHLDEPLFLDCGGDGRIMVAACRIDNRMELAESLGIRLSEMKRMSDSLLVAACYKKWEISCVERLLGDWSFAVWDGGKKTLTLCRDHYGNTGLFYYHGPRSFAFSTSIGPLLALPDISVTPDLVQLSRLLLPGLGPHPVETPFRNIRRLPPAHTLYVSPGGLITRQYWFLENTPQVRFGSDEAYVEAFSDIFAKAVRCRIRSTEGVGISLSAGMDSGAVAVESSAALAASGCRLAGFCSVPMYDAGQLVPANRIADETSVALETAGRLGNVDMYWIRSEGVSPIAGVRGFVDTFSIPSPGVNNSFWILSLLKEAQNQGVRLLFTGQGGNGTISWTGSGFLPSLALAGRWVRLYREIKAAGEFDGRSAVRILLGKVLMPFLPHTLQDRIHWLRQGNRGKQEPVLKSGFVSSHRLYEQMAQEGSSPFDRQFVSAQRTQAYHLKPGRYTIGHAWQQLGNAHGMHIVDPTLDKRVIEFTWAIPPEQHVGDGRGRALVRRAMAGRLPERVLWPRKRGLQSADLPMRLRACLDEVWQVVEEIGESAAACELLDMDKFRALVRSLENDFTPESFLMVQGRLLPVIQAGLFLLRCEKSGQEKALRPGTGVL